MRRLPIRDRRERFLGILLAILTAATSASAAQQTSPSRVILNQSASPEIFACKAGVDLSEYRIARVTVQDPFQFLYAIGRKTNSVEARISAQLLNRRYGSGSAALKALDDLYDAQFLPNHGIGYAIRLEFLSVQNCNPNSKTLELIYRVYSTAPPKSLGGATEAQATAQRSPQTTAGLTEAGSPLHFTPAGGFNPSYRIFGGGHVALKPRRKFLSFDTLAVDGVASTSMHRLAAAASGSADRLGWLKHYNWRLNYLTSSTPASPIRLNQSGLSGQGSAETRAFWNGDFFARFGGLLEGGNTHSNPGGTLLPAQSVAGAGYGLLRGYAGLSSRTSHNVLDISYGLELGSIGPSAQIDWRKHIADIVDEFWLPVGEHKPLQVESRFTLGATQVPHSIPESFLFFGGSADPYFIPGDSWQIRDEPVIRAIPAGRFYLTSQGAGADSFASTNLTIAVPAFAHPLVPKAVSRDKEFTDTLNAQINTAANVDQQYYAWKDARFQSIFQHQTGGIQHALSGLQKAVDDAQNAHPSQFPDAFADCETSLYIANFELTGALQAKNTSQYSNFVSLLAPSTPNLPSVHDACAVELNQPLKDRAIADAEAKYNGLLESIQTSLAPVNVASKKKASDDIAFVRKTLNTLFKDLDIYSVSPVFVFDTAWIGPASATVGGYRIGPGGGIRLELASSVNFTLGYAWNLDARPGEGHGAVFFEIRSRELFH